MRAAVPPSVLRVALVIFVMAGINPVKSEVLDRSVYSRREGFLIWFYAGRFSGVTDLGVVIRFRFFTEYCAVD